MKRLCIIILLFVSLLSLGAQNRTQNGALTSQKKYPLLNYFELPQPSKPDPAEWGKVSGVMGECRCNVRQNESARSQGLALDKA